jgi:hypothetical protein
VKPLSVIPKCIVFLQVSSFPLVLAQCPYKECIIISDALFLEVSFSSINYSEFLVPTHNIRGIIVSEKSSESVFGTHSSSDLPTLSFRENVMKPSDVFGMYSSSNLPILYRYTHNAMPQPSEECWWNGGAEGEAFMGSALIASLWKQ